MIRNQQSNSAPILSSINKQLNNDNNNDNNYNNNDYNSNYSDKADVDDDTLNEENTDNNDGEDSEHENLHENTYGYALESVKMTKNGNKKRNQYINDESDYINHGENDGYGDISVNESKSIDQKHKIRKIAQKFEVPDIVFQFLCISAKQFNGNYPSVSTSSNVHSDVGTGTLLRTFSLQESLSDIVEKCFLARDSDAFVDATGKLCTIVFMLIILYLFFVN